MKNKMYRFGLILAIVACVTIVLACSVGAAGDKTVSSSTYYKTSSCTAGVYKNESVQDLHTIMPSGVYGGDVGIWFYDTSVGLQASYNKDTSRYVYMECREQDVIGYTLARKYYAAFQLADDGLYKPYKFGSYTPSSDKIEGDGDLELYMRFGITTDQDDSTKAVPAGILCYKFWAYSE